MLIPIAILFTHWVGDFLLQTSEMAFNKSKSIRWLTIHVLVYGATLMAGGFIFFSPVFAVRFALINVVLHWVTDFFTSKLAAKYVQHRRIFFIIIGFDQFIHALCLLGSLHYLMNLPVD